MKFCKNQDRKKSDHTYVSFPDEYVCCPYCKGDLIDESKVSIMSEKISKLEAELNSCEHDLGDWIVKDDGIRYRRCMKCKKVIVEERIPDKLRI